MPLTYAKLNANAIIVELDTVTRWEAIDVLIEALVESGQLDPRDKEFVLAQAKKRETTGSTAAGFGFAFPHARVNRLPVFAVAIGRSIAGVEWDALDEKPVHFAFLIMGPSWDGGKFNSWVVWADRVALAIRKLPDSKKFVMKADDFAHILADILTQSGYRCPDSTSIGK